MAKIIFAAAVFLCLFLYTAENPPKYGKLLSYDQQTFITYSQATGTGHEVPHTTYSVQVDAGDRIYYAERTVEPGWYITPKVTVNGPVQWMLDGKGELILIDHRNKAFVLTITKTRLKTLSQQ